MSLLRFKYLHKHRLLTLILILTLTSTLFSVTAFSFLGFYNGFTGYVGTQNDIVAIYQTKANTPITGIVPLSLADSANAIHGVLATSAEVIVPCVVNDKSIFIRGILPESLSKINPLSTIEGSSLNENDTQSTIIGNGLQENLKLKTGDNITIYSVVSDKYVNVQVKGVFTSNSPLDDEALVPIYVGQWLRGINYNEVTVIRAKIDPNQLTADIIRQVIINQTSQTPTITASPPPIKGDTEQQLQGLIIISQVNINLQNVGIEQAQDFMKNYLGQYGVSKDTLLILSALVLVFASGTAAAALSLFINQHRNEIGTLRSIGASNKKIKTDLIIKLTAWSLAASTMGTILSAAILLIFQQLGYLQVLSHRLVFQLDPTIIAANFILISALIAVGVTRLEMKP